MAKLKMAAVLAAGVILGGCNAMFIVPDEKNTANPDHSNSSTHEPSDATSTTTDREVTRTESKPVTTPAPSVDRHDFKDKQKGTVLAVAMSADSKYFASACSDGTVKIWKLGNSIGESKTITGKDEVGSVSFGNNGKTLATSHWSSALKLWDTSSGNEIACKVKAPEGFTPISVALSPDGKTLAVGGLKDIKIFSVSSGAEVRTLSGHSDKISNVVFSPDGKQIASASRDKTGKVWNVNNGQVKVTINGTSDMFDVSFQMNGKNIALLGWNGKIKMFEVATGKELFEFKADGSGALGVGNMAISPDGEWLGMGNVIGSSFSISEIGQRFNWLRHNS